MTPAGISTTAGKTVAAEIETYVRATEIDVLLKRALTDCFKTKPSDPVAHLLSYLAALYPSQAKAAGFQIERKEEEKEEEEEDARDGSDDVDDDASSADATVAEVTVTRDDDDDDDDDDEDLETPTASATVTVRHPDPETERYLNEHLAVKAMFETIADRLASDRPEKPLQHVVDLLALAGEEEEEDEEDEEEEEETSDAEEASEREREREPSQSGEDTAAATEHEPPPRADADADADADANDDDLHRGDDVGEMPELRARPRPAGGINYARRPSVSAECVTMNASCVRPSFVSHSDRGGGARRSSRGEPEPPSPNSRAAKTAAQRDEVRARVRDNILFKDLDAAPLEELVDAAFEVSYPAGAVVIEQGDEGDNFYVVADGVADAAVRGKIAGDAPTTVQVLEPGASFGELSLMYNSPRAATVTARTACRLWALDRETFRDIACVSSQRTRKTREGFLERVPVLSALTAAERSRVADAIETKSFARGDAVVSQGEDGDAFYIVERGQAAAVMTLPRRRRGASVDEMRGAAREDEHEDESESEDEAEKAREGVDARERDVEVKRYVPGDYFGELALLTEKRRAATVRAVSDVLVCAVVSRATFTRLMGSCETIMKRNIESYKEIMMTLGGVGSA